MTYLGLNKRVPISIGLMVITLFILTTARRFAYPFLPVLMQEFHLTAFAATLLVAMVQIPSVLGILWGPLGDKYGYRKMMTAGILVMACGFLGFVVYQSYWTLLLALFCAGLGKNIYDPNGQARANESVARKYRGMVTGILETGWAYSTLIGVPLIAILLFAYGWRAPFFVLACGGLIILVLLRLVLKPDSPRFVEINIWQNYKFAFRAIFTNRAILALALFFFFVGFANDSVFIVYSRWFDSAFGLGYLVIGVGTAVIGVAELCGELTTAFLAEKLGYRRVFLSVFVIVIFATSVMVLLGATPTLAWIFLFGAFFGAEALIVTGFAYAQDFMPENRATILSVAFTATNIGRIAGAFGGSGFWALGSMGMVSACSTICLLLSLGFLVVAAKYRRQQQLQLPL